MDRIDGAMRAHIVMGKTRDPRTRARFLAAKQKLIGGVAWTPALRRYYAFMVASVRSALSPAMQMMMMAEPDADDADLQAAARVCVRGVVFAGRRGDIPDRPFTRRWLSAHANLRAPQELCYEKAGRGHIGAQWTRAWRSARG